jgi:hypothetical protein
VQIWGFTPVDHPKGEETVVRRERATLGCGACTLVMRLLVVASMCLAAHAFILPTPLAPAAERSTPMMRMNAPAALRAVTGAASLMLPGVAAAAETGADALPDDSLIVGFAIFLLLAAGALQLSLGDIVADEAQLPSSVTLINKNKQRRSSFIKGKKD